MRAGTITMRVGTRLVAVRADTDATLSRLRTLFAAWIDPDHPDVPWAFDVRLAGAEPTAVRGPRPVPQLRIGQTLLTRSRSADEVLAALAHILGGVLAGQDDNRLWLGLRALARGHSVILLDARPPLMSADRELARHGVAELPVWNVAFVPPATVEVPPPLPDLDWRGAGLDPAESTPREYRLAGIVAVDDHHDHDQDDADGVERWHATSPGAQLARFGARLPSAAWFHTIDALVEADRVAIAPTRQVGSDCVIEWLAETDASTEPR